MEICETKMEWAGIMKVQTLQNIVNGTPWKMATWIIDMAEQV